MDWGRTWLEHQVLELGNGVRNEYLDRRPRPHKGIRRLLEARLDPRATHRCLRSGANRGRLVRRIQERGSKDGQLAVGCQGHRRPVGTRMAGHGSPGAQCQLVDEQIRDADILLSYNCSVLRT